MKKILIIALLLAVAMMSGCSVPDSEFSRDTMLLNQDLQKEEVITKASDTTTDVSKNEKLILSTGEWAPYVSESIDDQGFTTAIVKQAFAKVDIDIEIKFYSWARALEMIQSHDAFGTYTWSFTEERSNAYKSTNPLTVSDTVIMYTADNVNVPDDFTTVEALASYRIGGVKDYAYLEHFNNANIEVDLSDKGNDAIVKLYNGRFDLLPTTPLVAMEFIKEAYPDEIDKFRFLKTPMETVDMGILVDKNYPEADKYIEKFNEGLKMLKDSGEYSNILRKHGFDFLIE